MGDKITESEKLLNEEKENKRHLEEDLIEKEKLKGELETELKQREEDKNKLASQIKDRQIELPKKKEKVYRVFRFVKTLIERSKIQAEINKLEIIKKRLDSDYFELKENIEVRRKKISLQKQDIETKQKEISYILSQRKRGMELFENRWVKEIDIPKLKEARLGITNNFSNLSPYEFEHFVAKLLREIGYTTTVTQKTGDYGVDIIAKKDNNTIAVQCKRFKEGNLVSNRDIQRILGAMHSINANKCIFVTTSKFTKQAIQQARGCSIELWDKEILHNLVKKHLLDLEIKEIFSLMEREKKEKIEREKEQLKLLEEKKERKRLKREERKERLEEKRRIEREKRTCQKCGGGKMKTRKYCSNCKRKIRMKKRYASYDYGDYDYDIYNIWRL